MGAKSTERVAAEAAALGFDIVIETMPESTRTAAEAAAACGVTPAQIVKSLVFERVDDGGLVLLLAPGDRSVDLDAAGALIGAGLDQADAKRVRAETGFAIGGVAPFGHTAPIPVFMDESLLAHETVWAAAGAPNAVFSIAPQRLQALVNATVGALSA